MSRLVSSSALSEYCLFFVFENICTFLWFRRKCQCSLECRDTFWIGTTRKWYSQFGVFLCWNEIITCRCMWHTEVSCYYDLCKSLKLILCKHLSPNEKFLLDIHYSVYIGLYWHYIIESVVLIWLNGRIYLKLCRAIVCFKIFLFL